jgi:hypothetical protein
MSYAPAHHDRRLPRLGARKGALQPFLVPLASLLVAVASSERDRGF